MGTGEGKGADPRDRWDNCRSCPRRGSDGFVPPVLGGWPVWPDDEKAGRVPVVLVGRDPGEQEVSAGEPFVGPAGKVLNLVLGHASLSRLSVGITNACLCNLPGNPPPTIEEIACCRPLLLSFLRRTRPKVIVTLGGEAALSLLGEDFSKVTVWRGTITYTPKNVVLGKVRKQVGVYKTGKKKGEPRYRWSVVEVEGLPGIPVVLTVHPSFVMRTGFAWLPYLLADLRKAALISRSANMLQPSPPVIGHAPTTLPPAIVVDVETSRDEQRRLRVIGISSSPTSTWVVSPTVGRKLLRAWAHRHGDDALLIGHNITFDLDAMKRFDIDLYHVRIFDTMQAAHFLRPDLPADSRPLALDSCISREPTFRYEGWKERFRSGKEPDLRYYCGLDCGWTYLLYEKQVLRLDRQRALHHFVGTLMPLLLILDDMERRGFPVDTRKRSRFRTMQRRVVKRLEEEWNDLTKGVNPSSTPQLRDYFYRKLGLPVRKDRKTGRPTLDREAIEYLHSHYPSIRELSLLVELRHARKMLSTYLEAPSPDGRLHFEYKMHGTFTGRLSGNGQQIPRYTKTCPHGVEGCVCGRLREMFVGPGGVEVVAADFSNIEARLTAILAGEAWLIEAFDDPDFDYHQVMADRLTELTGIQISRKTAKVVNHGMNYGMGVRTLARTLGTKMKVAREIMQAWEKARPATVAWRERLAAEVMKKGYVDSPFGRRFYFRKGAGGKIDLPKIVAAIPQSVAADVCFRALVTAAREKKLTILAQAHDEIVVVGEEEAEERLREAMEQPIPELDGWRCPADVGRGESWATAKK